MAITPKAPSNDPDAAWDAFAASDSSVSSGASGERAIQTDSAWARGTLIADRYRLADQIGEGGMGRVFAAHDELVGRDVAIKIVSFDRGDRDQLESRFRREVEIAMQLHGAPFVPVLDHAIRVECAYLAMELLDGESLQSYLSREGRLDRDATLHMLRGVAGGLAIAHDLCIVHRDLKPSNVFLARGGLAEGIRLIDFGIAKDLWTSSKLTMAGALLGSPHYASPEQARCVEIDHRSDLWSLGVILFRCLTGRRPFEGKLSQLVVRIVNEKHPAPSKLVTSLPASVDEFFERALAKRPEARFQDVREMLAAFEQVVAGWPGADRRAQAEVMTIRAAAPIETPSTSGERISERTVMGGESYETYAALASTERNSIDLTVEIDSPLHAQAFPSAAPAALAAPQVAADAAAPLGKQRVESSELPSRLWETSITALMLIVVAVVVLWIASR